MFVNIEHYKSKKYVTGSILLTQQTTHANVEHVTAIVPIEFKQSTQLLGVHFTKDISNKIITVQKFYGKVNSFLYDFKNIPCHVKSKLLATYCLDNILMIYMDHSYGITAVLMFNRFMLLGAKQ